MTAWRIGLLAALTLALQLISTAHHSVLESGHDGLAGKPWCPKIHTFNCKQLLNAPVYLAYLSNHRTIRIAVALYVTSFSTDPLRGRNSDNEGRR